MKTSSGGQPSGSWDDQHNHWDVDDGTGTRRRYTEDGTEVDHDNKPVNNPGEQPGPVDRMVQGIRDFLNRPVPSWFPEIPPLIPPPVPGLPPLPPPLPIP